MRKSGTPDQSPEDHRRDPVPEDRGAPVRRDEDARGQVQDPTVYVEEFLSMKQE